MAVFGLLCAVGGTLGAIEVTPEMASRAVKNWRATQDVFTCPLGLAPRKARACQTARAKFNVVQLEGGGFVVTSADTSIRPIVFFSDGEDLDEDPRNPLMGLLEKDLSVCAAAAAAHGGARLNSVAAPGTTPATTGTSANEQAWAELLDETPQATLQAKSISDVRAGPIVQSAWGQSTASGKKVYNYYTPNNYVCGCVATATAQVMRYFQWPKTYVKPITNTQCKVDGTLTTRAMYGGTYDWANMTLKPASSWSISTTVQQAIGKLTYDCGVGVSMSWSKSGSGANTFTLSWTLVNVFGYSQAVSTLWTGEHERSDYEWTRRALLTNFDMGLPVILGIDNDANDAGHCIVGDGYGYSGSTLYYHLNYGWSGSDDGWYAPPDLDGGEDYSIIDEVVYNIYTNQAANKVIVSGRLLGTNGKAANGVTVTATKGNSFMPQTSVKTNSKGIFAMYVDPSSTYTIRAESGLAVATATAQTKAIRSIQRSLTDGCPRAGGWYSTGNRDAEPCNAHVGDLQLVSQTPIAKIGSTNYLSLQAACDVATAGQTVTMVASTVEDAVTVTKGITIDFAGYTLTGTLYAQNNTSGQTLTLKNGTISGASDSFDGAAGTTSLYPNGAVRFENMRTTGTIWSDDHPLTFVSGTYEGTISIATTSATITGGKFANLTQTGTGKFVITGGSFASAFNEVASLSAGRAFVWKGTDASYPWEIGEAVARVGDRVYTSFASACAAAANGDTVTLLVNNSESAVSVSAGCTIDLSGYTFSGTLTCANAASTTVVVQGGTVSGVLKTTGAGNLTVSGGTIATVSHAGSGTVTIDDGSIGTVTATGTGSVLLIGGYFATQPSGSRIVLDDGARWRKDEQNTQYPWMLVSTMAMIGETKYKTLAAACAAVTKGQTIVLVDNDDEAQALVDKDCTIDFGGYTFSGSLVCTNAIGLTTRLVNGHLTGEVSMVGRGSVSISNACTVATMVGKTAGTLRVDGGTVTTIRQEGTGKILVTAGEITTITGAAFTMSGGTVNAATLTGAVVVSGGTVTTLVGSGSVKLSGGEFGSVTIAGSSTSSLDDVTIAMVNHTGTCRLNVTSGYFRSFTTANKGTVSIRGGRFGEKVEGSLVTLLEGTRWRCDSTDSVYPWYLTDGIARIGDVTFSSLSAACEAVAKGQTIVLFDNDDEAQVVVDKDCTIDFGGFTFSGSLVCTNAIGLTTRLVNGCLTGDVSMVGRGSVSISNNCTVATLTGESAGMLRVDGGTVETILEESTGKVLVTAGRIGTLTGAALTLSGGTVETATLTGAVVVSGGSVTTLTGSNSVKLTGGTFGTVNLTGTGTSTLEDVVIDKVSHTGTGRVNVLSGSFGSFTTASLAVVSIRGGRFGVSVTGETVTLPDGLDWVLDGLDETYPWTLGVGRVKVNTSYYTTLALACAQATHGSTIQLRQDSDEDSVTLVRGCTLDFGDHAFSGQLVCTNVSRVVITIVDGTFSGSVVAAHTGKVVLEGGRFAQVDVTGTGSVEVKGGRFATSLEGVPGVNLAEGLYWFKDDQDAAYPWRLTTIRPSERTATCILFR